MMEIWSLGSRGQSNNFVLTYGRAKKPVDGVAIRMPWSLLNPAIGTYNFEPITDAINAAGAAKCSLSVTAGALTPGWVTMMGVQTYTSGGLTAPVPWDPVAMGYWETFVKNLGASFQGKFDHVVLTGPLNFDTQEILLPTDVDWAKLNYNNGIIEDTFIQMGTALAMAFPSVRLYPCMGRNFLPRVGRANPDDTENLITDMLGWATPVGLQNNGFGHGMIPWSELLTVTCPTGLQEGMPLGSTAAIQAALAQWATTDASFLEVYPEDLPLWPT